MGDFYQYSIFDIGKKPFRIDKPIRLIELFAGIGSQAKALEKIGADFERYRVCEFDKYAIKSYNAIHGTDFSASDITQITAEDLGIVDTDMYCYILTYSFPCQDLSLAGKQKLMKKGSGTRSSLLWEVERLLNECNELPQVLLMENVIQVHNKKNTDSFSEWIKFLESKGYNNYWKDLNSKDFGIPQNRNRCLMISVLGDYTYEFPKHIPLKLRLRDMLEDEVDEKFYLSDNGVDYVLDPKRGMATDINPEICQPLTAVGQNNWTGSFVSTDIEYLEKSSEIGGKSPIKIVMTNGAIFVREANKRGYTKAVEGDSINIEQPSSKTRRGRVGHGVAQTLNTSPQQVVITARKGHIGDNPISIRKLTPKECFRLMGFSDEDFARAEAVNSNTQLYKQAGNSIVVDVIAHIFTQLTEI